MTDQQYAQNFDFLVGKTIASVRYMTEQEAHEALWSSRPLIIRFTDGSMLIPQMDDEGNDGGAMFYQGDSGALLIHTI
jgi:hypothetical protein